MNAFTTTRVFKASPAAVFAAFSEPARLARWWGPDGFRNTFSKFEFKPGGQWLFIMHGPDGTNYPNEMTFVAIEPARQVVMTHTNQPYFQLTIRLEGTVAETLVTWEQVFENAEIAASIAHIVEPANEQNLNRWQAEVAAM